MRWMVALGLVMVSPNEEWFCEVLAYRKKRLEGFRILFADDTRYRSLGVTVIKVKSQNQVVGEYCQSC